MIRRLVGVAALTAALLVGTATPGLAEDISPGGAVRSGSTWPAWRQSMPSPTGPTSGHA